MIVRRRNFLTVIAAGACKITRADESVPRKSPELAFTLPKTGPALLSHYRGKVVALEFILTTCGHCQAAAKVMTKMQKRYGAKGLQVLDVAINPNADLLVENFAREHGADFPVGWTALEQMMAYMGYTGLPTVPQLILIDRPGMIRYQTPRLGDAESLREETINARLGELIESR